jgi:hypothetical protein
MLTFKRWQLAIIVALSAGFISALYTVAEFGRARLVEAAADAQRAHEQWIRVVDLQQGMRYRIHVLGGRMNITTAPSRGMRIHVQVPLESVVRSNGGDPGASGAFATVPWVEPGSAAAVSGSLV